MGKIQGMLAAGRRGTALLVLAMVLGYAEQAGAYVATLRWTEPSSSSTVASFTVYLGSASGLSDVLVQSLGHPTPDGSGVYTATVTITDGTTVYASLTATDSTGSESSHSNTIQIQTLGAPGQPTLVP